MGSARFLLMLAVVPALIAASDAIPVKPANEPAVSNEISTDRPDFTESTDTMAFGTFQLESGLLFSGHGPSRQVGGPFPLLRIGLTRFAELRLGTDGLALQSDMEEGRTRRQAGGSDAEVAVKVRLWEERKYVPALAAIAGFSFPVGSRYFTSGGTDPVLDFCWSKSLPRGFDAGGNINFRRETAEGETEHAASLTIGKKLAHGFRTFGEIYRISPIEGDEAAHWVANTGITRLLGMGAQADFAVGHTIHARTAYWFVGVGFAIRFKL